MYIFGTHSDCSAKEWIKKLLDTNGIMTSGYILCEISGISSRVKFLKAPYMGAPYTGINAFDEPFYL